VRIAFITDPLDSFRIYKDSTFAMMEEAARRGHALFQLAQSDLALERGRVVARAQRIELTGVAHDSEPHGPRADWYRHCEWIDGPLAEFDAVLMRKDPPFDMEYVTSTWMLERAQAQGARVFNDPRAIRDHNEKFVISEFSDFTAATLVTRSILKPGTYSGAFPFDDNASWEKNAATLRQLHALRERLRALEKKL